MKTNILITLMCLFTITAMAQKEEQTKEVVDVTFNVPIDCQGCIDKINSNIAYEKGVKAIQCSLAHKTVSVSYRTDKTDVEKLKIAFEKIGYKDVTIHEDKKCESEEKEEAHLCSGPDHKH